MTKSLISYGGGYVAGFWNGLCGEVDKSKPPVGALALAALVENNASNMWVADLLIDQHVLWNRWWSRRLHDGMIAPGSTREMMSTPIACTNQDPVVASRCETGLDNSPLYDDAKFITSADTIDSVDVGMTALVAADSQALAKLSIALGRTDFVAELQKRAAALTSAISGQMWDSDNGLYFNRMWSPAAGWAPTVAAPTNFYPMLASVPTDSQASEMIARWLTNSSEFGVNTSFSAHGMPSVSRSSPAFKDNSYWRGRAWGPM
jgi:putative isomerase